MDYPVTTGNIILIVLGAALVVSGPYITYRTIKGVMDARKQDPGAPVHYFSNGINFLIAIVFFFAGILFIRNNLAGNPLALLPGGTPPAAQSTDTEG
ncbi:MAG: hypothetical protein KDD51_01795 [Bdellovibrionales bacterium]|nr:hypothetical protein [Bdellovibrionales bacterium]